MRWIAAIVVLLAPGPAFAHPGGVNAEGCHTNRKTGDYHCHGQGSRSSPERRSTPRALSAGVSAPFVNCAAARAAGADPVYAGEPGYGPHLDRDGDGIGCEPYRGR